MLPSSNQEVKKSGSVAEEAEFSPVNRSRIFAEAPSDDGDTLSRIHTTNVGGNTETTNETTNESLSVSCEEEKVEGERKTSGASHSDDEAGTKASTMHTDEFATPDWTDQKQKSPQTTLKNIKIKEPLESDIIFGRGKPNHDHPGNRTFRKVVETYQDEYSASRRYDKLAIAQEIITGLEAGRWSIAPARFLKRDDKSDFWTIASDEETREKVRGTVCMKAYIDDCSSSLGSS